MPKLRPDLNGKIIVNIPGTNFLIDRGQKRGYTNAATFARVHNPDASDIRVADADAIITGPNIPDDACIVRNELGVYYLLDRENNVPVKRFISQEVAGIYQFRDAVYIIPDIALEGLQNGAEIEPPH